MMNTPPAAPFAPITATPPTGASFYSPKQIGIATFLGTPIAGGVLLHINERRAGTSKGPILTVAGIVLTVGLAAIGTYAGGLAPMLPFAGLGIVHALANRQAAYHRTAAAPPASWRLPTALGLGLCLPLVAAFVLGTIQPPAVSFGSDHDVQYVDGATESEARTVGEYLQHAGYFADGRPATVRIKHDHASVVVSFVVREGAWDRPEATTAFRTMRGELATQLHDEDLIVKLVDSDMDPHLTIN
jgi:hypothetical protein